MNIIRITESEQADRKDRMIHTAYRLFCEYGIDSVSVSMIAKESGLSSQSVFRYFETKALLLQCTQKILWQEIMRHILCGVTEQLHCEKTGFEEMEILLGRFKNLYEEHSEYLVFACEYKIFLLRNHIKMGEIEYKDMLAPVLSVFKASIKKGQIDGSISKNETVEAQFMALWGVLRGYVEEIVIYDRMYAGENPWKGQFDLVLKYTLSALKIKD